MSLPTAPFANLDDELMEDALSAGLALRSTAAAAVDESESGTVDDRTGNDDGCKNGPYRVGLEPSSNLFVNTRKSLLLSVQR